VSAAQAFLEAHGGAPGAPLTQITGASVWREQCAGKTICLVAVLPGILDDGATKRNARLETLQAASGKVSGSRVAFAPTVS
jgi:hypothetical protein